MSQTTARKSIVYDLVAGISVALLLIPQSLAYAELAGLPAYVGLFAAALPLIAAAFFASSPYLQTGPVAMTALLTFGVMAQLEAPAGSTEYLKLAALLALLVGAIRIVLGSIGGGIVAYLMSQPVLIGFTSAAAILIAASQLPKTLGVRTGNDSLLREAWIAISSTWDWRAVGLSVVTVGAIVGGRKLHALFPGVLAATLIGLAYSALSDFDGAVVGSIPSGFPPFSVNLPWSSAADLMLPAIAIALVGFAEPASIARAYATLDRQVWNPDRELVSQGVANVVAGLFSGFPLGGSFSRSSVARMAGARTSATGAIAGITVLVFLPFAGIIEGLPVAVLGAIVIAGVYKLIRVKAILDIWKYSRPQAVVAMSTFALTLTLAPRIDQAVVIGIVMGVAVHLWREMRLDVASWTAASIVHLQPHGVLYFGSAPGLGDRLNKELAEHPDATHLHIELQRLGRIDYTGALALKQAVTDATEAGLSVCLAGVPDHARRILGTVWEGDIPETDLDTHRYMGDE